MSNKHFKPSKPSDVDLYRNPLIGGSKGATMAHVTPDELEEFEGVNTIEGDVENETNDAGGIDKADVNDRRRGQHNKDRDSGPRRTPQQGKKSHEQQLRMLESKPDVPDPRRVKDEAARIQHDGGSRTARHSGARGSELAASRGGIIQESQHNKHNHPTQAGHKPQKPQGS